jgi:DNA-binding NtrC family response regulator
MLLAFLKISKCLFGGREKRDYMKILLIDDEPDILLHMKKALKMLGHSCESFVDPLAALNHFGEEQFDVVISDVLMPSMNGFDVAKEIHRRTPETKIILVSGHLTPAMEVQTGDYSSVVYLHKPIDVHTLKSVLDNESRHLQTNVIRDS